MAVILMPIHGLTRLEHQSPNDKLISGCYQLDSHQNFPSERSQGTTDRPRWLAFRDINYSDSSSSSQGDKQMPVSLRSGWTGLQTTPGRPILLGHPEMFRRNTESKLCAAACGLAWQRLAQIPQLQDEKDCTKWND